MENPVFKTIIKMSGVCPCCETNNPDKPASEIPRDERNWFSVLSSPKDKGYWVCEECAEIIEAFLKMSGLILVRPLE